MLYCIFALYHDRTTVDWTRWRHEITTQRGPALGLELGPASATAGPKYSINNSKEDVITYNAAINFMCRVKKLSCNMCRGPKKLGITGLNWFLRSLEYYHWIFVTLILSPGLSDPVFKNKKIPFPSTAVYHKNYTENMSHWAVWALAKLFCAVNHTIFDEN